LPVDLLNDWIADFDAVILRQLINNFPAFMPTDIALV
jgi:hypothetical protein